VTASGIVAILGSVLTLLGLSLGLFGLLIAPMPPNAQMPAGMRVISLAMLLFFMACAVFGIVTGVGLLHLKNWARISALAWSGITVFFTGFALLLSLVIPMPPPRNAPDFTIYFVCAALFLIYGLPCAIGTWWLILFTRKPVVAQFVASIPGSLARGSALGPCPSLPAAPARPGLPVPLAVFATFLVISSPLSILFLLGSHLPAIFLGVAIRGRASTVFYGLFCLLSLISGIGLFKLQKWSYPLALGIQVFGLVNGVISFFSPQLAALQREILSRSTYVSIVPEQYAYWSGHLRGMSLFGLLFPAAIVFLLVYYRSRFLEACTAKASPPR
jgi:hypothetical protein